jgi:hypothetical protein
VAPDPTGPAREPTSGAPPIATPVATPAWSPDFHANGPSIAAFLAAAIGLLTLSVVQIVSHVSEAFNDAVFTLGKTWIPGADGIGPYAGKETLMLVVWLFAWAVLGFVLRRRQLDTRKWFGATLALLFLAAVLIWPPVWHLFE